MVVKVRGVAKRGHTPSTVCSACRLATNARTARNRRARRRALVIKMYGGRCACCGIDRPVFLTLDHVQDNGAADRREPGGQLGTYTRALVSYRPDLYQILCWNCNAAKQIEDNHSCKEGSK